LLDLFELRMPIAELVMLGDFFVPVPYLSFRVASGRGCRGRRRRRERARWKVRTRQGQACDRLAVA
jgi:hypothetical protein